MSERSMTILAALLDHIKDENFTFPPTLLKKATWRKLQDDKQFNDTMEFLGRSRFQFCVFSEISRRVNWRCYRYWAWIRSTVGQGAVSLQLRDAFKVRRYYDHPLETIAGAMYDEDQERFKKWAIGIYGPLIDLVVKIERKEKKKAARLAREKEKANTPAPLKLKGIPIPPPGEVVVKKRAAEENLEQQQKGKKRRIE